MESIASIWIKLLARASLILFPQGSQMRELSHISVVANLFPMSRDWLLHHTARWFKIQTMNGDPKKLWVQPVLSPDDSPGRQRRNFISTFFSPCWAAEFVAVLRTFPAKSAENKWIINVGRREEDAFLSWKLVLDLGIVFPFASLCFGPKFWRATSTNLDLLGQFDFEFHRWVSRSYLDERREFMIKKNSHSLASRIGLDPRRSWSNEPVAYEEEANDFFLKPLFSF